MIRYHTTWARLCQFVMCLCIFFAGCREKDDHHEDHSLYYLPVDSLSPQGMRYTYRNLADSSLGYEVWEHIKTSDGHVLSINYDQNGQVVQKQYERVVHNGVLIDSLHLFYQDSLGLIQLPVKIISPHRFPFEAVDSSQVWLTHLEWWQPGDSLHVVLERRRRFLGDTTWQFDGKLLQAIRFGTHDKFETEEVGWTTSE